MKLIEKWWEEFRWKVLPRNASSQMVAECRQAFFSGVGSFFSALITETSKKGNEDLHLMDAVAEEVTAFFNERLSKGND